MSSDYKDLAIDLIKNQAQVSEAFKEGLPSKSPRFANVSCSQCGDDFGPGDSGFSHCADHRRKPMPIAGIELNLSDPECPLLIFKSRDGKTGALNIHSLIHGRASIFSAAVSGWLADRKADLGKREDTGDTKPYTDTELFAMRLSGIQPDQGRVPYTQQEKRKMATPEQLGQVKQEAEES